MKTGGNEVKKALKKGVRIRVGASLSYSVSSLSEAASPEVDEDEVVAVLGGAGSRIASSCLLGALALCGLSHGQ